MSLIRVLRRMRGRIIDSLPNPIKRYLIYRYRLNVPYYKSSHKEIVNVIKQNGSVKVLFVISSISMWKYDEIYRLLIADNRFEVKIIAYPFNSYTQKSKLQSISQILDYFHEDSIEIFNATNHEKEISEWISTYGPEIMFYQSPYEGIYNNDLESKKYYDRLICYTPYGIGTAEGGLYVDTPFHNVAWKIFMATNVHLKIANKQAKNRGENIVVVGESNSGRFLNDEQEYPWKQKEAKKIIWAPHYSIATGDALHRAGFLWLFDFMLRLPELTMGAVQIAFKPHPKLKTMLYKDSNWGIDKTNRYFDEWGKGEYTQICEGDYAALFATSDAMIHDSSSFIGEYMYTKKPVLFTSTDIESIRKECNLFGNMCLDLHYMASTIDEVLKFINTVVLEKQDTLKVKRKEFFDNTLVLSDGLNPGKRIYNVLLKEFQWS